MGLYKVVAHIVTDLRPQTPEDLAAQLETFVQDEIVGLLQPIQQGVSDLWCGGRRRAARRPGGDHVNGCHAAAPSNPTDR